MAFFRPFLSDAFFSAPSSSLLSPSSSILFDDEPLFSATPLYLLDTPASRRRGGRSGRQLQQQASNGDNVQAMVSGGSNNKHSAATPASPSSSATASNKQTATTTTNNSNSSSAVVHRNAVQPRLLSPLSLLTPFSSASSLLSPRAMLPSMSVDMLSSATEYTVHASVPGVAKADLKVTVDDGVLTIEAERRKETKQSRRPSGTNSSNDNNNSNATSPRATSPSASTAPTDESKYEEKAQPASETSTDSASMDTHDDEGEAQYQHVESFYGHVSRSITLPNDCVTDGMLARYEDGVLRISIPRAQEKRQRGTRLEIQ